MVIGGYDSDFSVGDVFLSEQVFELQTRIYSHVTYKNKQKHLGLTNTYKSSSWEKFNKQRFWESFGEICRREH